MRLVLVKTMIDTSATCRFCQSTDRRKKIALLKLCVYAVYALCAERVGESVRDQAM